MGVFASTDRRRTTSTPLTSTLALALALTPVLAGTSSPACPPCPPVATYMHPCKTVRSSFRRIFSDLHPTRLISCLDPCIRSDPHFRPRNLLRPNFQSNDPFSFLFSLFYKRFSNRRNAIFQIDYGI